MNTYKIKINANCLNEFSSMIQTCANDLEDAQHNYLFTALYNAEYIGGRGKSSIAELTPQQIKLFIHFIQNQMEYMEYITIDEMKYDGGNGDEIKKCRYDIASLGKLMKECEELLANLI